MPSGNLKDQVLPRNSWTLALLGLRGLSALASLVLVAAFARTLPGAIFANSQAIIIAVGTATSLADIGLSLATTRAMLANDPKKVAEIFALRTATLPIAVTVGFGLAMASTGGLSSALIFACYAPYAACDLVYSHTYAQLRARRGMGFELLVAPLQNIMESLIAGGVLVLTRDVYAGLLTIVVIGFLTTAAIVILGRRYAAISFAFSRPHPGESLALLREGVAPLTVGLAVSILSLELLPVARHASLSVTDIAWLLVAVRVIGAAYLAATSFVVMPVYLRARARIRERRFLVSRLAAFVPLTLCATLATGFASVSGHLGTRVVILLGELVMLSVIWLWSSTIIHQRHALQSRGAHGALLGAFSFVVVLPSAAFLPKDVGLVGGIFVASCLAIMGNLISSLRKQPAARARCLAPLPRQRHLPGALRVGTPGAIHIDVASFESVAADGRDRVAPTPGRQRRGDDIGPSRAIALRYTTHAKDLRARHSSSERCASRRAAALVACLIVLCLIPVRLSNGTAYGAEPVLLALTVWYVVRGHRIRVNGLLVIAGLFMGLGTAYYALGLHGAGGRGLDVGRAYAEMCMGIFVLLNYPRLRRLVVRSMTVVGLILGALVIVEFTGHLHWTGAHPGAVVGTHLRVWGPLGPGPTATVLLCAVYCSFRRRRVTAAMVSIAGLVLTGSRAHYIGLVGLLLVVGAAALWKRRVLLSSVGVVVLGLLVEFPGFRERIANGLNGADAGQRTVLWSHAVHSVSIFGSGLGGFLYVFPRLGTDEPLVAVYSHNLLLTWLSYFGLCGLALGIGVIYYLLIYARRTGTLPLAIGLLAASMLGEFLWGPTPSLALGAVVAWFVVMDTGTERDAFVPRHSRDRNRARGG